MTHRKGLGLEAPLVLALVACQAPMDTAMAEDADHFVLSGGVVVGLGPADVEVRDGRIVAVGGDLQAPSVVDVSGRWLAPAFIDSHVHLAYDPRGEAMLDGGVAGAVDWAAPVSAVGSYQGELQVKWSGPMITAPGGYPTQGWGANGYGLECATPDEAAIAVISLLDAGASVVKLPLGGGPVLSRDALVSVVETAHSRGAKVGAHAFTAEQVAAASAAGVDLLVHAPSEWLSDLRVDDFEAVIPTLGAFGAGKDTLDNLRRMRTAGVTMLYGTDFGNARVTGISAAEIDGMMRAGMDGAAILEAGTRAPAAAFGFEELGAIEVGRRASLLVLAEDPLENPRILASAEAVYINGNRRDSDPQRR